MARSNHLYSRFTNPDHEDDLSFVRNPVHSAEAPPFIMFSLLLLVGVAGPRFVNGQIAQTSATCTSDYSWMGNSKGSSPCLVAAQLDAQCNGGCEFLNFILNRETNQASIAWDISAINGSDRYTNPKDGTASLCTW
jgi:hypothetical protein